MTGVLGQTHRVQEEIDIGTPIAIVEPATATETQVHGTAALNGDNTVIASPGAGSKLVITAFVIQNEAINPVTMQLIDGAGGQGWRCFAQNQGDGLAMSLPFGHPWRLTANTALVLNLSAAQTCNYSIHYYTE